MNLKPFYGRLLAAFQDKKGRIYGFPKDWSPLAIEVNTTMLASGRRHARRGRGRSSPAALQKLKTAGQPPACLSIDLARILAFMYQNRGGFLNATKTAAIVNSAANVGAVGRYFGWLKSGLAQDAGGARRRLVRRGARQGEGLDHLRGELGLQLHEGDVPGAEVRGPPDGQERTTRQPRLHGVVLDREGLEAQGPGVHAAQVPRRDQRACGVWTKNVGYLPSRRTSRRPTGRKIFLREAPSVAGVAVRPGLQQGHQHRQQRAPVRLRGQGDGPQALNNIQDAATAALRRGR